MPETSSTDLLLYWLSARGAMGVATWRAGCRHLSPPPPQGCQDPNEHYLRHYHRFKEGLLRAGHIEFDARETRVQATPPTLIQTGPDTGFLCGARLPDTRDSLEGRGLELQVSPGRSSPALWRVRGHLADLDIRSGRIAVHPERGEAVLRSLPSAGQVLQALPTERPPAAVPWERLEIRTDHASPKARWTELKGLPKTGLYRRAQRKPPDLWLFDGEQARPLPRLDHRRLAHWSTVGRAVGAHLRWNAKAEELDIPVCGARLPMLLDRFLRSASGEEPRFLREKGVLRYRAVGLVRARHVARILEWTLKTDD